ncbi:hypothetical protein [Luteibacter sp. E-22]|uniref:hypothetical protein n=1 Tax=Luteibacter sp. E-22 TaxID=3404050 RepID=UPI003CE726CC
MISSPWAVLLCKFNDDDREPYPRTRYEELFSRSGIGKRGMVDYFSDMSHGNVDLSGTRVFGWWTLDRPRSDFKGFSTSPGGRNAIIDWARAKAAEEGVDLAPFHSVIVCLNVDTDLFGSPYGVCCDDGRWTDSSVPGFSSMSPCILGQEMGHGYGLNHSRIEGGDDYSDDWDIMSTAVTPFMAPHPVFTELDQRGQPIFRLGPGLNAANMAYVGWLDGARVWDEPDNSSTSTEISIRPLHRRDLNGFLAIKMGDYYIEFRMNDRWDAAIPNPCVLVHRLEGGVSYLQRDNTGNAAMTAGSWFGTPPELSILGAGIRIQVRSIDAGNQIARIGLTRAKPQIPRVWPKEGPYRNPGVAWLEGAVTVNFGDSVLTIPKDSPFHELIALLALHEGSKAVSSARLQHSVRTEALSSMVDVIQRQLDKARAPRVPGRRRP